MPIHKLQSAQQAIDDGKFSFSPPMENATTGGRKMYARDLTTRGSPCPQVLLDCDLRMPFALSAGKGKEITPDSNCNLELSLNEQEHPAVVQYFKSFDANYCSFIQEQSQEIFKRKVSPVELSFMSKGSLNSDKKVDGRYLLRLKVSRQNTTVYVVTQSDGNVVKRYRQGSLADLKPGCTIIPCIKHVMGYTGASQFGFVHSGSKLLVFPYQKRSESEVQDDDEFPFGDSAVEEASDISPTKRSRPTEQVQTQYDDEGSGQLSDLE